MKNNTDINIIETFSLFKKNIKAFCIIMGIGLFFAIAGVAVNILFNKPKINIDTKIVVVNAFENYALLDLLILDNNVITSDGVAIMGMIEKIGSYEKITQQYTKLVRYHSVALEKSILNNKNYDSIVTNLDSGALRIVMNNVINLELAREDVSKFVDAMNNIVSPIVLKNFEKENQYIKKLLLNEDFMGVTNKNFMKPDKIRPKLNMLYNTRVDVYKNLGTDKIRIFESSSKVREKRVGNKRIFGATILGFFCFFMLLIIIRK